VASVNITPLLLDVEVMDLLRINSRQLAHLAKTGSLVPVQVGPHRRYRRADVEALIGGADELPGTDQSTILEVGGVDE
jgi:hypothetical protein